MKKLLLSVFFVILFVVSAYATTFEVITVSSVTPIGFTSSKLLERNVSGALCIVEGQDIRMLYGTSTSPTTTVGMLCPKNTSFRIDNQRHMETFKAIATSGTATISVIYEP